MTNQSDRVCLVRDAVSGIEAIHAGFSAHAYDLHRHHEWLVGVTDRGAQHFLCRGFRPRSMPGQVVLIEPGEAHDGQAGAAGGFAYRMLYLPQCWMESRSSEAANHRTGFASNFCDDAALAGAVRSACGVLERPSERLLRHATLDLVFGRLRPHLGRPVPDTKARWDGRVARLAREQLHEALLQN